ncbi:hypothetical protein [Lysinibacillus sp. NPDC059133]|uniref:hypothetical protein n=1 Tax=Lysinibacillus sp. NPDC059133 TaxID=3346737 RepID=UPI00368B23C0
MIRKFEVEVVRTDKYVIEIDDEVINEKWMDDFSQVFYDFYKLEEHAKHIAQFRARFNNSRMDAGYIEGYGMPYLNGQKSIFEKNESMHQPAINIRVVSEDDDIEMDVTEI